MVEKRCKIRLSESVLAMRTKICSATSFTVKEDSQFSFLNVFLLFGELPIQI